MWRSCRLCLGRLERVNDGFVLRVAADRFFYLWRRHFLLLASLAFPCILIGLLALALCGGTYLLWRRQLGHDLVRRQARVTDTVGRIQHRLAFRLAQLVGWGLMVPLK